MGGRRVALLVATDRYQDSGLSRLAAPASDARRLAAVLSDMNIAGFEVTRLYNRPHHVVGRAIGDFYRDRKRGDLALLYFTGHGVKDEAGNLYLAMTDTDRGNLQFTGVQAEQIRMAMDGCLSRQKVLVLDCCYAGAFPVGLGAKGDSEVHALEQLTGRGCVVLTSSDAMQLSFEGDQVKETGPASLRSGPSSLFTRFLIEGLRTGKADLDGDGDITLDELYSYVHDRVTDEQPLQRPKIKQDVEGRIRVAQNVNWTLPSRISDAISSPYAAAKLSALEDLRGLYNRDNAIVKERVLETVRTLAGDDSRSVSEAADSFLSELTPENENRQAGDQAERDAQEAARREAAAQETARREAEEQAAREAAAQETARREAEEQAAREAEEQAAREAAAQETARREAEEQAAREAAARRPRSRPQAGSRRAGGAAQETARREAEEQAAREAEEQAAREAAAQETARREAEEQAAREAEEQAAREAAAQETARREAEEQAAREAEEQAAREAEEQAAREAARREAEERAAREAASRQAQEQAAQEAAAREAAAQEQALREAARREPEERAQREPSSRVRSRHAISVAAGAGIAITGLVIAIVAFTSKPSATGTPRNSSTLHSVGTPHTTSAPPSSPVPLTDFKVCTILVGLCGTSEFSDKMATEPTTLTIAPPIFSAGYRNTELTNLKWSDWGNATVHGAGTLVVVVVPDNCTEQNVKNCVGGTKETYSATVTLSDPKPYGNGNQAYRSAVVSAPTDPAAADTFVPQPLPPPP